MGPNTGTPTIMTKKIANPIVFAAAATLSVFALPAAAATWQPYDEAQPSPTAIYSTDVGAGNVLLACGKGGKISVIIATTRTPIMDLLTRNAPYSRGETVNIQFGDKPAEESEMRFIPAAELLESRAYSIGAKLFNAAIRQESVSIAVPKGDQLTFTLPEPDATFKAFANRCAQARTE